MVSFRMTGNVLVDALRHCINWNCHDLVLDKDSSRGSAAEASFVKLGATQGKAKHDCHKREA